MGERRDDGASKWIWPLVILAGMLAVGWAVVEYGFPAVGYETPGAATEPTGEPVTADTAIHPGMRLQVQSQGSWYVGRVVSVNDDGTVEIHYESWDSRYDEDVPRDRLRVSDDL
ncbi:MAG TPA: hypothetical protein RMH99_08275 [Sandaracinaceae bacterium LLY-WYZ-13_1]|nr:hypothetical protein [Sandaracinaceae bacterium LLY-WYZ-13_1]